MRKIPEHNIPVATATKAISIMTSRITKLLLLLATASVAAFLHAVTYATASCLLQTCYMRIPSQTNNYYIVSSSLGMAHLGADMGLLVHNSIAIRICA